MRPLRPIFRVVASFGTVQSAGSITDRVSGPRQRGTASFDGPDAQAQAAIRGLDDQDHDGRRLTVDEARPRVARTRIAGGGIEGSGHTGGGRGYEGGGDRH